jgi:hypothetical protein
LFPKNLDMLSTTKQWAMVALVEQH